MSVRDLQKSSSAYSNSFPGRTDCVVIPTENKCDLCVSCISHLPLCLHLLFYASDLNAKSPSTIEVYSTHGLLLEYKVLRRQSYHCCDNITQEIPYEVCHMFSAASTQVLYLSLSVLCGLTARVQPFSVKCY